MKQRIRQTLDHGCDGFISLAEMHQTLKDWAIPLSIDQFMTLAKSSTAFQVNYSQLVDEIFTSETDDDQDPHVDETDDSKQAETEYASIELFS